MNENCAKMANDLSHLWMWLGLLVGGGFLYVSEAKQTEKSGEIHCVAQLNSGDSEVAMILITDSQLPDNWTRYLQSLVSSSRQISWTFPREDYRRLSALSCIQGR